MFLIIFAYYRVSFLIDKVAYYEEVLTRLAEKEARLTRDRRNSCQCAVCRPHDVANRLCNIATDRRRASARIARASREMAFWERRAPMTLEEN